ncbi:MAG TPA: serine hydrolase domain-containing protein [Anaerolineaceae bacterium]|nr:serine hydrolase domain-containing protein [Anaerolineaceae bacterium]
MKKLLSTALALLICASTFWTVFAAEGDNVLPSGLASTDIEATIDRYVAEHTDTTAALAVAVFTGNEVLVEKTYGFSDLENAVASDKDTVFEWGSVTKLLVWTSVMQLVENSQLSLSADIRTYLPAGFFTKLRFETPITMLHLMNHNAGWQETPTDLFLSNRADVKELGDALRWIEPEQVFEPGTVVAYSNWGAALAGYIVERVSGQLFDDYVHEYIFTPLGMEHTALNPTISDNEWVAARRTKLKTYTPENQPLGTNQYYLSLYPAGMATGTLGDFIKFGQAFLTPNGEKSPLFADRKTLAEMLSPSLFYADGKTARNAHGFWTNQLGVPVLWHNGGTKGSTAWFTLDPESGTALVTFTNQPHEWVYNCGLLPLVFGTYADGAGSASSEDISGVYVAARTGFKGFAKPSSLFSMMELTSNGEGGYSIPGLENSLTPLGNGAYLLQMGGLKEDIVFESTDEAGRTVLQYPGLDYIEVNGSGVIAEFVLLLLFILAGLYGFFALLIGFIGLLRHTRVPGILEQLRTLVHVSVLLVVGMFVFITVTLLSNAPMWTDVQWSLVLNGLLALVPVAYAVLLAVKWKKLNCTAKERVKLAAAGIAGLVMTTNVIFWEAYKFW